MKKKVDKPTDQKEVPPMEAMISQKIQTIIRHHGLTANAVARGTGIDNANFYRMLDGKRHWKIGHLETVCGFLGVAVEDVMGGPIEIPVVASISALAPFRYPVGVSQPLGTIEYKGKAKAAMLKEGMYALKVADRSMMPAFKSGTTFVVEKDSAQAIQDEDLVVCPDDQGNAQLCRVEFTSPESLTMRPINPTMPQKVIPRTHLKLCDQVIAIYLV